MKPRITPERLTEQLNVIRQLIDKDPILKNKQFTKGELLEFLEKNGLYVNPVLWAYLKDIFVCERVNGVNQFSFKKDAQGSLPIYKGVIEQIVVNYRKKMNDSKAQTLSIDSAIKLLKSKGYKIQKPVISYKEV